MLYKFDLDHEIVEAAQNICCVKGEGPVDHSRVTRWFKKFCSLLQEPWQSGKVR